MPYKVARPCTHPGCPRLVRRPGAWMTKIATPPNTEPTPEPTIEERLARIEADLDKLLAIHPEITDA